MVGSNPTLPTRLGTTVTQEEIEAQAEKMYYEFSQARGLQYPWNMLDENTKSHWYRRVQRDI